MTFTMLRHVVAFVDDESYKELSILFISEKKK